MHAMQHNDMSADAFLAMDNRKFHILLMGVVAARKTRRVAALKESNPGLVGRWQAQICTGMHAGGFTQRSNGELYRLGSFQAARRS